MKGRLCGGRQRARSGEDKALREQQILDAAGDLFASRRYDNLTLADVAAATGLTKAALYRYFRSKELLFIAVYRRTFKALADDLQARGAAAFPDDFMTVFQSHPLFCSLTAILHVALETGLTESEARQFKLFLLEQTHRIAVPIVAATGQNDERCFDYLMQCQQALIGCWHMTHPPDSARKAMATPPLTVFHRAFEPTLQRHLEILTQAFMAPIQRR